MTLWRVVKANEAPELASSCVPKPVPRRARTGSQQGEICYMQPKLIDCTA